MVELLRRTDMILGDGIKAPTTPELEVRVAARRSVTLARDVAEGIPSLAQDLCLMRPGDGIPPAALEQVVGRCLQKAMVAGQTIHWEALA